MSEPFLALFKHQHDHHSEYAMVYSDDIEDRIDQISAFLETHYTDVPNRRWASIKLLERDKEVMEKLPVNLPDVLDRSYEIDIIRQKYDFIEEIIGPDGGKLCEPGRCEPQYRQPSSADLYIGARSCLGSKHCGLPHRERALQFTQGVIESTPDGSESV